VLCSFVDFMCHFFNFRGTVLKCQYFEGLNVFFPSIILRHE
jgi:hypothetical protein